MARGNRILLTVENKGSRKEGIANAGETIYPGTIVQIDPTQDEQGGRFVVKLYDRGADGDQPLGAFWVVLEDELQGKGPTDAYTAGTRIQIYSPLPGDELNLLISDVSGSANITKGTILMVDDGTGELIATTGSPETEVAVLLETVTIPLTDRLAFCEWTGH